MLNVYKSALRRDVLGLNSIVKEIHVEVVPVGFIIKVLNYTLDE